MEMHAGSRLCGNLMSPTTKRLESGLCSSSSLLPPRVVQQYDDNHTSTLFAGDDETIPAVRAIGHRLVYRFEQARALPESQSSPDRLGFASCGGRWLLLNTALVFLTFARTDLCYSRAPAQPRILRRAIYRARDHLFPGGPAAAALGAGLGWVPAGCGAETSARALGGRLQKKRQERRTTARIVITHTRAVRHTSYQTIVEPWVRKSESRATRQQPANLCLLHTAGSSQAPAVSRIVHPSLTASSRVQTRQ